MPPKKKKANVKLPSVDSVFAVIEKNISDYIDLLKTFANISLSPGVSDRGRKLMALKWSETLLKSVGAEVEECVSNRELEGRGLPVLLARLGWDQTKPTVFVYCQLDSTGQNPAFASSAKYVRGRTVIDAASFLIWINMAQAHKESAVPLPYNIKFCLDPLSRSEVTQLVEILHNRIATFLNDVEFYFACLSHGVDTKIPNIIYGVRGISDFFIKINKTSKLSSDLKDENDEESDDRESRFLIFQENEKWTYEENRELNSEEFIKSNNEECETSNDDECRKPKDEEIETSKVADDNGSKNEKSNDEESGQFKYENTRIGRKGIGKYLELEEDQELKDDDNCAALDMLYLMNSLVDITGNILIDGLYDDVPEITQEEKYWFASIHLNVERLNNYFSILNENQCDKACFIERLWRYPTVRLKGIETSGSGDDEELTGGFTVLTVPNHTPRSARQCVLRHLTKIWNERSSQNQVEFGMDYWGWPWRADQSDPKYKALVTAIQAVYSERPESILSGSHLPFPAIIRKLTKKNVLIFSLGSFYDFHLTEDERLSTRDYIRGISVITRMIHYIEPTADKGGSKKKGKRKK